MLHQSAADAHRDGTKIVSNIKASPRARAPGSPEAMMLEESRTKRQNSSRGSARWMIPSPSPLSVARHTFSSNLIFDDPLRCSSRLVERKSPEPDKGGEWRIASICHRFALSNVRDRLAWLGFFFVFAPVYQKRSKAKKLRVSLVV